MFEGLHEREGARYDDLNGMATAAAWWRTRSAGSGRWGWPTTLRYLDGGTWIAVPSDGAGGHNLRRDPTRPGTVWAAATPRWCAPTAPTATPATTRSSPSSTRRAICSRPWRRRPTASPGSARRKELFRLDANAGTYQYFTALGGISVLWASPLAVTPDGRLWFAVADLSGVGPHGLLWFDGTHAGLYPAPLDGGPQWGGLPHAQIAALEVRLVPGGYELWMSCMSRGIAVLFVPMACSPTASKATTPRSGRRRCPESAQRGAGARRS